MAAPIDLRNDFDSVSLRRLAKRTRDATQSRRLLALAEVYDGGSRTDASRIGGVGLQIIRDWVLRFNARGPDGLVDGKSPGAPSKLNADHRRALAEVVEAGPVPAVDGVVRWRRKDLARWLLETFAISLDETTVGRELNRIWRAFGLQPHRSETFKLSSDPFFVEKVRDIVGLYLAPPDRALVLCVDEKSQIQALDRSQPLLPMRPGRRSGAATTTSATARPLSSRPSTSPRERGIGLVMPWCDTDAMAAHREFRKFSADRRSRRTCPADRRHPGIGHGQLRDATRPRRSATGSPTSAVAGRPISHPPAPPELNQVERWFGQCMTRQADQANRIVKSLHQGVGAHHPRLHRARQTWNPKPFKWTKSMPMIMSLGMRKWAHAVLPPNNRNRW